MLGTDAGACLSAHTFDKSGRDRFELSITVKVLWVKVSKSVVTESSSFSSSASLNFSAYNTFNNTSPSYTVHTTSISQVQFIQRMMRLELLEVARAESLGRAKMKECGLEAGKLLPLDKASKLCKSGLVVTLLLFPYARLMQYISAIPKGIMMQLEDEMQSITLGGAEADRKSVRLALNEAKEAEIEIWKGHLLRPLPKSKD